ncbi:hypothetical protein LU276_08155 [Moraxella haemolytica]|uniref:hypothetical protein n=1 Tax=Moraxella haemolytica TaxID=2904119 RepID=UPI002542DFC7|nr:hypothetical protein [Moraxella sp. ZY171148]WII94972.1 hypothetical protein LU276_08155 [Moraxella sp. ZY171148]
MKPATKQVLLSVVIIAVALVALQGCVSMSLEARDRAYEGERAKIAEYRALADNKSEDY